MFHADTIAKHNPTPEQVKQAHEASVKINLAYETLKDPTKKAAYDITYQIRKKNQKQQAKARPRPKPKPRPQPRQNTYQDPRAQSRQTKQESPQAKAAREKAAREKLAREKAAQANKGQEKTAKPQQPSTELIPSQTTKQQKSLAPSPNMKNKCFQKNFKSLYDISPPKDKGTLLDEKA